MTRLLLACVIASALLVSGCGDEEAPAGSGVLIDGTPASFEIARHKLEGTPVVVNQWASWCGPCRFEFPFFRSQAEKLDGKVEFLGVASRDSRNGAEAFLKQMPLPFAQYYDKDAKIARTFKGGRSWPTTAFYNATGELVFTHQGAYRDEQALAEDIQRYAIDG